MMIFCWVGRVYKIVGFRQLLSVKPAPTQFVGLGRVYFTCLFVLNIVGEPARCILKQVDCDLPLGGVGLQDCWF